MIIVNNQDNSNHPNNSGSPSSQDGKAEDNSPKESKYIIEIDTDLCIGAATCVDIAGDTFDLDEENKAIIKESDSVNTDEEILDAARSCPTLAIVIKDRKTGEQVFP